MNMQEMYTLYTKHNKADRYLIGFELNGLIFAVSMIGLPDEMLRLDKASKKNGGGQVLKLRITKAIKLKLVNGAECIGTVKDLKKADKNKGIAFEKLIARKCHKRKKHDNKCFSLCGDIKINNIDYQLKYERATICSEKTLERLEK